MSATSKCIVVVSGFWCCFLGASVPYISGIIHVELLTKYQESDTATALAGSISNSLFSLAGPIASILTNTFSCRVCILTGSILGLLGFGLSCLAENVHILYLTYGVLGGIGQSLIYTGTVVAVGYHFKERRNIAMGFVVSGCGVALLVLPPLMELFITLYGIQGTFLLLGAMLFQCCVFGVILKPNIVEKERKNKHYHTGDTLHRNMCLNVLHSIWNSLKKILHIRFLLICLSAFSWNISFNISYLYFPTYFKTKGFSSYEVGYLISATGIGNICTRFLIGVVASDPKIGSHILYFGGFSLIGLLTFLLPFYHSYAVYMAYMCCYGLYTGCVWVLTTAILVELVGLNNLASSFGVYMLSAGLGQLIVPAISGVLRTGPSHVLNELELSKIFLFSGAMFITAAVLCGLTFRQSIPNYNAVSTQSNDKYVKSGIQLNDMHEAEIFIEKE